MRKSPTNRYHAMEVGGLSGPRLVVFTYSHLLAALRQGHRAVRENENEVRCRALCRARDLTYELLYALDCEHGGEVARNLLDLYQYFIQQISHLDLHPDLPRLEQLIELVATLHEAWQSAASEVSEAPVGAAAMK